MHRLRLSWLALVVLLAGPAEAMALPQAVDCSAAKTPAAGVSAIVSLGLAY